MSITFSPRWCGTSHLSELWYLVVMVHVPTTNTLYYVMDGSKSILMLSGCFKHKLVCFGPKRTLTTLKRVYLVKRNLYIYSVRNFLSYPIWDITNTSPCRHNQTRFKAVMAHLGTKRIISIWLGVGRYTLSADQH